MAIQVKKEAATQTANCVYHQLGSMEVTEVILKNTVGARASVLTLGGATLRDLQVPMPDGSLRRVVLGGYAYLHHYQDNPAYLGSVVGRCCNRIDHDVSASMAKTTSCQSMEPATSICMVASMACHSVTGPCLARPRTL